MSGPRLNIEGVHKRFEGVKALDGFSCAVGGGEILGLIGPNGAGLLRRTMGGSGSMGVSLWGGLRMGSVIWGL